MIAVQDEEHGPHIVHQGRVTKASSLAPGVSSQRASVVIDHKTKRSRSSDLQDLAHHPKDLCQGLASCDGTEIDNDTTRQQSRQQASSAAPTVRCSCLRFVDATWIVQSLDVRVGLLTHTARQRQGQWRLSNSGVGLVVAGLTQVVVAPSSTTEERSVRVNGQATMIAEMNVHRIHKLSFQGMSFRAQWILERLAEQERVALAVSAAKCWRLSAAIVQPHMCVRKVNLMPLFDSAERHGPATLPVENHGRMTLARLAHMTCCVDLEVTLPQQMLQSSPSSKGGAWIVPRPAASQPLHGSLSHRPEDAAALPHHPQRKEVVVKVLAMRTGEHLQQHSRQAIERRP